MRRGIHPSSMNMPVLGRNLKWHIRWMFSTKTPQSSNSLVVRHVPRWPSEPRNLPITIGGIQVWRNIWPPDAITHVRIETPGPVLLHSRNIGPFRQNLQLPAMQLRFVQNESLLNSFCFYEFHVGKSLGLAKFVSQYGHSINSATWLEMLLHFFRRACIINPSQDPLDDPCQQQRGSATNICMHVTCLCAQHELLPSCML